MSEFGERYSCLCRMLVACEFVSAQACDILTTFGRHSLDQNSIEQQVKLHFHFIVHFMRTMESEDDFENATDACDSDSDTDDELKSTGMIPLLVLFARLSTSDTQRRCRRRPSILEQHTIDTNSTHSLCPGRSQSYSFRESYVAVERAELLI